MATYLSATLTQAVSMRVTPTDEQLCNLWGLRNKSQLETLYVSDIDSKVIAPRLRVHSPLNTTARDEFNLHIRGDCVLIRLPTISKKKWSSSGESECVRRPDAHGLEIRRPGPEFDEDGNRNPHF